MNCKISSKVEKGDGGGGGGEKEDFIGIPLM